MNISKLFNFDDLPVMISALDQNEKIVYANNFWLDETGYKSEDVINNSVRNILSEKSIELHDQIYSHEIKQNGELYDVPLELVRKDGKILQILTSAEAKEDGLVLTSAKNLTNIVNRFDHLKSWLSSPEDLSSRLYDFRKRYKTTQDEISEILQISTRTYQRLEQDGRRLTLEQIRTLCIHFEVSPYFFFTNFSLAID